MPYMLGMHNMPLSDILHVVLFISINNVSFLE